MWKVTTTRTATITTLAMMAIEWMLMLIITRIPITSRVIELKRRKSYGQRQRTMTMIITTITRRTRKIVITVKIGDDEDDYDRR